MSIEANRASGGVSSPKSATKRSLRVRLTLWVILFNSVILWSAATIFWLYQSTVIEEVMRERLVTHATVLGARMAPFIGTDDADAATLGQAIALLQSDARRIQVFDADGTAVLPGLTSPLMISKDVARETVRSGEPTFAFHTVPAAMSGTLPVEFRVVTIPLRGTDGEWYALTVASGNDVARGELGLLTRIVLLVGVIGTIASAITGWFVAGVAVAPLNRLRRLASRLAPDSAASDLDDESIGDSREVSGLAREIDVAHSRFRERFAAQERFLLNVSHEFKTPISVLLTEAQTIDRAGLTEEGRSFVESVEEEMLTLGRLVESFLTLTRIEVEERVANFRPYALNDLLMDCVHASHRMAEQRGVTLAPSLISDDAQTSVLIYGERELLRTMLENLIRNAVVFSPTGGMVEVVAIAAAGVAMLAVRDLGPGIPADQVERIFDRFAQASDGSGLSRGRGHGLGLAIAMGIAELHRGTIAATNRAEGGCEFVVTLPLPVGSGAGS